MHTMRLLLLCVIGLSFGFLHGCAKPKTPTAPIDIQHKHLLHLTQWQAKGKIGFTQGKHGESASFEWKQAHARFQVHLFGPFGAQAVFLQGTPEAIFFVGTEGKKHITNDPETWLHERLGWYVPIESLSFWLKGLPNPAWPSYKKHYDREKRLTSFFQKGWTVFVSEFQNTDTCWLPKRLVLTKGQVNITFVFKRWLTEIPTHLY